MMIPVCFNENNDKSLLEWLNSSKGTLSRSAYIRLILEDYMNKNNQDNKKAILSTNSIHAPLENTKPQNQFTNKFLSQIKK